MAIKYRHDLLTKVAFSTIIIMTFLWLIFESYADGEEKSLILNGGFELGGDIPDHWIMNDNSPGVIFKRDTEVKRSGSASGCIIVPLSKEGYKWPGYNSRVKDVKEGQLYNASFYIKTECEDETTLAYAAFEFMDKNDRRITFKQGKFVTGKTDWTKVSFSAEILPNTKDLNFRLMLYGSGKVWFDDVSLTAGSKAVKNERIARDMVKIDITRTIINGDFMGFGAQGDSALLWNKENREKGVDEKDIELNLARIKSMKLSIARVFVWWKIWNPSCDYKTFTWDSEDMTGLCKMLEFYKENDVEVVVCGVEWGLKPYKSPESYAVAVGDLLDYLINQKKYTCIKYWTLINEPDLEWRSDFNSYMLVHKLVIEELKKHNLRDKIKIVGSDDAFKPYWLPDTAEKMHDLVDIYSSHVYTYKDDTEAYLDRFKNGWKTLKEKDPGIKDKKYYFCEFGIKDESTTDQNNAFMRTYEHSLLTGEFCINALNNGIDAVSIWCIHRVYYPGYNFMDFGLWEFKDKNWEPRPVFYLYSLFTGFCRRNSRVIETKNDCPDLIKSACIEKDNDIFIFILNKALNNQAIGVAFGKEYNKGAKKYIYSESILGSAKQDALFAEDKTRMESDGNIKDVIPARSLQIYHLQK